MQIFIFICLCIAKVANTNEDDTLDLFEYDGHNFPKKYLEVDKTPTAVEDLNLYIATFNRTMKYLLSAPNETEVNTGLSLYLSGAILKNAVLKYGEQIDKELLKTLKMLINDTEYLQSYFLHLHVHKPNRKFSGLFSISQVFRDNSIITKLIGDFNKGRLQKWIYQSNHVHSFVEEIDGAILDRELYVQFSRLLHHGLYINIDDSDHCVVHLPFPPSTLNDKMKRCHLDDYCREALKKSPSIAYTLSHRVLNILLRRLHSYCYLESETEDLETIDMLCSYMYRESIYLARLGFFARDIFMEHVALCGLMGYEEFFRKSWFHKMASWVDKNGCMREDNNYVIRGLKYLDYHKEVESTEEAKNRIEVKWRNMLKNECHRHPMILNMVNMAAAIRHTIHYKIENESKINDEL